MLKRIAGTTACLPLATSNSLFLAALPQEQLVSQSPNSFVGPKLFSDSDDALLQNWKRQVSGIFGSRQIQIPDSSGDRCNIRTFEKAIWEHRIHRFWIDRSLYRGKARVYLLHRSAKSGAKHLAYLWKKLPNHRGFYYHWANINTGERLWDAEISSIDTAILLCGVLTCRQHFHHSEISLLAYEIFNRVDWNWLSEDTALLPHGWRPESGFLQYRWDNYNEMMMMYLLGLGSGSHPLSLTVGTPLSEPHSNMTAFATSVHLRHYSYTNIPSLV